MQMENLHIYEQAVMLVMISESQRWYNNSILRILAMYGFSHKQPYLSEENTIEHITHAADKNNCTWHKDNSRKAAYHC